ncbi:MAG: SIS domain-containing protein [Alphaproteobacteria bacterium]|jgi:6-phospho-3-hexuloisomerase
MSLADQITQAAGELAKAATGTNPQQMAALVTALATAGRVVTFGCGREGLMMRALAMRLYHLGLNVHVAGDMSCPPVGKGDLFLVASGPGELATVAALLGQARAAGAQTGCITAQPTGPDPVGCDLVLTIPAQTMADDQGRAGLLPMGSVFEGAMFVVFEIMVLHLRDRLGETMASMRTRHTNLE